MVLHPKEARVCLAPPTQMMTSVFKVAATSTPPASTPQARTLAAAALVSMVTASSAAPQVGEPSEALRFSRTAPFLVSGTVRRVNADQVTARAQAGRRRGRSQRVPVASRACPLLRALLLLLTV